MMFDDLEFDMNVVGWTLIFWSVCIGILWIGGEFMGGYKFWDKIIISVLAAPILYVITNVMINR